jgi:hypothetical protein
MLENMFAAMLDPFNPIIFLPNLSTGAGWSQFVQHALTSPNLYDFPGPNRTTVKTAAARISQAGKGLDNVTRTV